MKVIPARYVCYLALLLVAGEFFREIIFFKDKLDLDKFERGEYTFAAQATGAALTAGIAAKTNYSAGTAVFVMAEEGLMVDISLGGQKFRYLPKADIE